VGSVRVPAAVFAPDVIGEWLMSFIRRVDWQAPDIELAGGYKGKFLFNSDGAHIIATLVPPGVGGPPRHFHQSDQIYFVVAGEITIELGSEVRKAPKNSVIFIPGGVPHHNWNEGGEDEVHFEVIAPGVIPIRPIMEPTDSTDARGLPYFVATADESRFGGEGFAIDWLVGRDRGSRHATVNLAEVPPASGGPPLHIHDFDQFYFVLEGGLDVQIGLREYHAKPFDLVVLPANVPHRQWNSGDVVERHATIIVPEPERPNAEERWDVPVALEETGVEIG
jgi:mannose-6-phosphate isomerase-like protein (cupin superfamily)